jgi:hypothetical protein
MWNRPAERLGKLVSERPYPGEMIHQIVPNTLVVL